VDKWLFEFNCRNSYLDVDNMIVYMNWMIICCWWWIYMPKVIYVGILCFCVKLINNEVVVVGLWVNSWLFVVDVVLEHVVDELISWVSLFVTWWWELLLLLKICESLVDCWILMKWCFNLKFYASLSVFSCIWLVNIFGTSFGHLKDQNFGFWVKRLWNAKIFDRTDERSLERTLSEL